MNVTFTYSFEIEKNMPNYFKKPLSYLTSSLPKITELEYLIEVIPPLSENGPWIAGGSLLRTKLDLPMTTDIDIFFKDQKQLSEYKIKLKSDYDGKKFTVVKDSVGTHASNVTIRYNQRDFLIQLVHKNYYDNACKVLDDFDLNICQLAYDGKHLYVAEGTIESIDQRSIGINVVSNAPHTMARCMKYAKYGFNMSNSEIGKFFSKISNNSNNSKTQTVVEDYATQY